MSDPNARKPALGSKFFAVMLMAIGAMILGLCGMCTVAWFTTTGEFSPRTLADWVLTPMIVAGIPVAIGALIFVVGFRLYRRS